MYIEAHQKTFWQILIVYRKMVIQELGYRCEP